MPNMEAIITGDNKKLLKRKPLNNQSHATAKKDICPPKGSFPKQSIIYQAGISQGNTTECYIQ